jgi:hypothetical protein
MAKASKCKSCGAAIVWAKTVSGKLAPFDAESHEDGTFVIGSDGVARFDDMLIARQGYRSHFATCPNAAKHRKKNPNGR